MKPSSAKKKGASLQKAIVAAIRSYFPELTEKDVRSTSMGAGGVDVQLSEAAFRRFPFAIESKNLASIAIYKHYKQAQDHAEDFGGFPLLVIKQNRSKPLAVLDLEHFLGLITK